jgi:hypothetical protein
VGGAPADGGTAGPADDVPPVRIGARGWSGVQAKEAQILV